MSKKAAIWGGGIVLSIILLHANPVAAIAARSARKANLYTVHQFVDGSFVVNSTNVPGLQGVSRLVMAASRLAQQVASRGVVYES